MGCVAGKSGRATPSFSFFAGEMTIRMDKPHHFSLGWQRLEVLAAKVLGEGLTSTKPWSMYG
jgi:Co/Zn/Cd efflux system component